MIMPFDVCDFKHIYNQEYHYSLPPKMLENFLSGESFDNTPPYTPDELARLKKDIQTLYQSIVSQNPIKESVAVISAGAPGAGKTVKIKQELDVLAAQGKHYAYVCPDDVCLRGQVNTYQAELSVSSLCKAYNKWRPGSNAATHLILANLIREKYAFYFGSTSSSPATANFFEFLKKQGYKIRLIHISAPDHVRKMSIQQRDTTFVQVTDKDIKEKGQLLPQRIMDTYLKFADEIDFYYRGHPEQEAVLGARWLREGKSFKILDGDAFEKLKELHNQAVLDLNRPDLLWENFQ